MRSSLLLAAAPLVLLCGCATAPAPTATVARGEPGITSPYGRFLAGEAALNEGRSADASKYFEQARAATDGDALVSERAFTAALLAGDIDKAAALAPNGDQDAEVAKRLGKLVIAVKDMADGKGKDAYALLAGDQIAFPHKAAAALLAPWAAAQAGDVENSIVRPEVRGDRIVDYFGQLGQALLFERAKRYGEAETDYKAAMGGVARTETATIAYGAFLERRGRRAEAQAIYDASLAQEPSSVAVKAARARVVAGKAPPPAPTIRQGAALALLTPAAIMTSAKQTQFALAYLRLALKLDPERDEAWVMLGDVMSAASDNTSARQAYAMVKPGSLEFSTAQAKLAWTYQNAGDKETALKLARTAAATGGDEGRLTLADLLRADEKFAESAEILTTLIHDSKTPDWRLLYARGVAYQRTGHWPEAEADLKAALAAQPDEPELLNYLGYSWIDRGEHLKEAMAMVEKAVGSDPRSGAMVDSLGWAYYRLGDYPKATEKLEEAVELDAGDPEINNHLGDAYWKVGRRDEAVFQWRRVLTLQPDDKIKADAERKIASNAGPDGPTQKLAEH
ncbi:tetratricopeptide repeat protein [Phenylobacterium sp.]|uniref:tetratricopeptide repeat protein n=1 Tax=Phenylobacterium sp. TaxID=1871053 RepID=UPI002DF4E46B|nr:tetratricopeptide repeat protein [Phenylobacterium sp.]